MITGQHYQNAYVTRDLDAAVARFEAQADVRASLRFDDVPVRFRTPEGEGDGVQSVALLWVEDLNIELITPRAGDVLALYRDALPAGDGLAFHHVCHRIDDWGAFESRLAGQPYPVVLRGSTPGLLEFVYLDRGNGSAITSNISGRCPNAGPRWAGDDPGRPRGRSQCGEVCRRSARLSQLRWPHFRQSATAIFRGRPHLFAYPAFGRSFASVYIHGCRPGRRDATSERSGIFSI
jgi:hypothetical protein